MFTALALAVLLQAPPDPTPAEHRTIEGQLVDPDGVPIAGAHLQALPVDGRWMPFRPEVITDDEGRFRFENVPDGDWKPGLYTLTSDASGLRDLAIEPDRFLGEGEPVRLVARVAHIDTEYDRGEPFCVRVPVDRDSELVRGEVYPFYDGNGHWLARRDGAYVIGLWSSKLGLAEVQVDFAAQTAWQARVRPDLPLFEEAPGRVQVLVPNPRVSAKIGLAILAPLSGQELDRLRPTLGDAGQLRFAFNLPPGKYLLRVEEEDRAVWCFTGDWGWLRHELCPIEVPVEVQSGSQQRLDLDWRRGVRPRLKFSAPGAPRIQVWLLDDRGRPTWPVDIERTDTAVLYLDGWGWPSGEWFDTRLCLPEGRQRLLVAAEGCQARELELDLVFGVPSEAELELQPLARAGDLEQLPAKRSERAR